MQIEDKISMHAFMEFIEMNGHAAFIWSSYGIVIFVLIWLFIVGVQFQTKSETKLSQLNPRPRHRSGVRSERKTGKQNEA
tara:strand:+ start:510 stop:749 length:240 start_codon:yes stop_codon:yes gene_type:complete